MRQRRRVIFVSIAMVSIVVLSIGLFLISHEWTSGAEEAQQDIQRGHLELRGYGLPAHWVPQYGRLLNDRLGVKFNTVAGCMVTRRLKNHTDEYNKLMTQEIERRYGAGILEKLADEASKTDAATRPAALPAGQK